MFFHFEMVVRHLSFDIVFGPEDIEVDEPVENENVVKLGSEHFGQISETVRVETLLVMQSGEEPIFGIWQAPVHFLQTNLQLFSQYLSKYFRFTQLHTIA